MSVDFSNLKIVVALSELNCALKERFRSNYNEFVAKRLGLPVFNKSDIQEIKALKKDLDKPSEDVMPHYFEEDTTLGTFLSEMVAETLGGGYRGLHSVSRITDWKQQIKKGNPPLGMSMLSAWAFKKLADNIVLKCDFLLISYRNEIETLSVANFCDDNGVDQSLSNMTVGLICKLDSDIRLAGIGDVYASLLNLSARDAVKKFESSYENDRSSCSNHNVG